MPFYPLRFGYLISKHILGKFFCISIHCIIDVTVSVEDDEICVYDDSVVFHHTNVKDYLAQDAVRVSEN